MSRRSHYDSASLAIGERSWAHGDFSWIESTFHQGIKGCATTLLGHRFNDVTETHEGETPPTGLKLALIGIVIKRFFGCWR